MNNSILKDKFGNYGLHIILNPSGTYSFVGSVPVSLGILVTDYRGENLKTPCFKTESEALNYAKEKLPHLTFNNQ